VNLKVSEEVCSVPSGLTILFTIQFFFVNRFSGESKLKKGRSYFPHEANIKTTKSREK
jgi:hypothetical protein